MLCCKCGRALTLSDPMFSAESCAKCQEIDRAANRAAREDIAFRIIEAMKGRAAADHASTFVTGNWTDALKAADAVLSRPATLQVPDSAGNAGMRATGDLRGAIVKVMAKALNAGSSTPLYDAADAILALPLDGRADVERLQAELEAENG